MTHQEPTEEELASAMDDQADALDRVKPGHLVATDDAVVLLRAAAGEIRRLVEALRSAAAETMEMLAADAAEISSLKVRVAELEAALDRYGDHDHSCPAYDTAHMPEAQRECDCGLGRLLTRKGG